VPEYKSGVREEDRWLLIVVKREGWDYQWVVKEDGRN